MTDTLARRCEAAGQMPARTSRKHQDARARVASRPVSGHHKVFLGMAAGVGKTYRALQELRAEYEAGRDAMIGYLEPHAREETEAQAEGLPRMARRRVTYKDVTLEELDLPALLGRRPEVALIDELAHTTVPEAHKEFRRAQLAGDAEPSSAQISDDEIRESIESNQLRLLRERGGDLMIFSPQASAMEHHVPDPATARAWARACNDLIARVV